MYCAVILLLEHSSFKKNGFGIINKVYVEASNIWGLIRLSRQKAPVCSLERKGTAIEYVNQCDWLSARSFLQEVDLMQDKCFNQIEQKSLCFLQWKSYY